MTATIASVRVTTTRPQADPGMGPWTGVVTRDELIDIGPDGPYAMHCMEYTGDELQRCLERLWADLTWIRSGQLVGPYADPDVDLDKLSPQAKQTAHCTISGVDLEETLTAWGSRSSESPMFIPGEHGRPPMAVRVDQVEPRIDPVLAQVEVPTQQVAVPDPLPSARDPIPDPQYRPDTYRETAES